MVVEKGFKQTEVGVIPENWEITNLGLKSKSISSGKSTTKSQHVGFYPIYGSTGIIGFDFKFDYNGEKILVARVGANAGAINIVDGEYNVSDNTLMISLASGVSLKFISYYLKNTNLNKLVFGSGQPLITGTQLKEIKLPLPPLPEQTAIANALSDMDALIAQTEKLIEKKKAIKQGVMQELLKPKEGWVTKKLGDYGKTYGGITGKTKVDFGKGNGNYIPFMNIMSNPIIDIGYLDKVDIKSGEAQNRAIKGDLFFNGSSETPEEVGLCSVLTEELDNLYLNSFCFGYRMNNQNDLNGLFLSYLFRSPLGRNLIFSLAQGATRYNLSKTNLLKLELPIPSKKEQDIIALTLQDLDRSITATQAKLQKLKHQKQGMMQALLTGKIRLI